jgi:hypothetical protein
LAGASYLLNTGQATSALQAPARDSIHRPLMTVASRDRCFESHGPVPRQDEKTFDGAAFDRKPSISAKGRDEELDGTSWEDVCDVALGQFLG